MIFPRLTANFITQELLTMALYAQKSLLYFYSVMCSHAVMMKLRGVRGDSGEDGVWWNF